MDKPTETRPVVLASPAAPSLAGPQTNLLLAYLHRFDREQTQRAYWNDLTQFFGTDHVDLSLARQATFLHVNEHIARLERANMKASTIKRRIAAIRGFYDWLIALELMDRNPANKQLLRRVRSARPQDRTIFFLTAEQAAALVEAAGDAPGDTGVRDRALVLTLLHCVLRRSEAAAMDVEHIRPLGAHWILEIPQAKGGADQYVKMPEHVVEVIEDTKRHYGIATGALWRSLSNNGRGNRLSPHSIYRIVRRAAERAGLPEIGAHTLRHTGCTLAIEAGASLQQVQTHARHKSIETTMTYVHQRDRLRDSAADYIQLPSSSQPPST
ncbi:MAG: integrase [Bacteroidetes bacterium]|nr:MAG: integrase [Bacteroidota bacterium]